MRNRLCRENQTKKCQKIEEFSIFCCEETDRARQAIIDELSMHQERNLTTVSQLLTQIQGLENKVNSLSEAKEFLYDPEKSEQLWVTACLSISKFLSVLRIFPGNIRML